MKKFLSVILWGIGIFMLLGSIGGIASEKNLGNLAMAFALLVLGVVSIYGAIMIGRFRRHSSTNAPARGIPPMLPEHPALAKIAELSKEATAKKKTDPNGAIRLLEQVERLERSIPMPPKVILDTRFRMATILYENGRLDEAEQLLLGELAAARRLKISKSAIAAADHHYCERLESLKIDQEITGEAPKDFELLRSLGEWPDFERNLYCLAIYSKLRIFYTKARRPDRALVFAMAETYAGYENSTHNEYCDNPAPDFTTVEKLLRQLKNEEDTPQWKAFLLEYTRPEPTCERCWEMIDAITASAEDANDRQITGK